MIDPDAYAGPPVPEAPSGLVDRLYQDQLSVRDPRARIGNGTFQSNNVPTTRNTRP